METNNIERENPAELDIQRGVETTDNTQPITPADADVNGRVTREFMQGHIERLKNDIESKKLKLNPLKVIRKHRRDDKDNNQKISELEIEMAELKTELQTAEDYLRTLPPDVTPDEDQPWFGRIYANGTAYYIEDGFRGWTPVTEENAKRGLRAMGISPGLDTETTSPLDLALLDIQKRYKVAYAAPLAGYKAGVTEQNGMRVLVTSSTQLIPPAEVDFPVFNAILDGLLREDRVYFDAFCKTTYEGLTLCLESGNSKPSPVLVLAGPKHCGKSLIQYHVITPLLGGKLARPYLYMSGQTSFNGELAGAGHHMLEDEVPAKDISARRKFGNYIKKAAANPGVELHAKGKDIKNLFPFTRLSVSVNDDEECLEVLPPLDDHLTDKLLILKCHKFPFPMLANTPAEQAVLEETIKRELPAYIYWLLNVFQIPEQIKERGRGGFKVVQNPEILEQINGTARELQLRELLEYLYLGPVEIDARPEKEQWFKLGSAQEVFSTLSSYPQTSQASRKVLPSVKTCGTYLSRLSERYPKQFRRYRGHGGVYKYEMYLDPEHIREMLKGEGYDTPASSTPGQTQ